MVSSVGHKALLKSLDILIVHKLPWVGQNLCDQASFSSTFRVSMPTSSVLQSYPELRDAAVQSYLQNATELLSTSSSGVFS